jgi:dTDP-4-amino-4,6-dideoxygalactose transaminase
VTLSGNRHAWHLYVIRLPGRDQVLRALHGAGIGAGIHYPEPIHLLPSFAHLGYRPGDLPVSEAAAATILSLPIYPEITPNQQALVAEALGEAVANVS